MLKYFKCVNTSRLKAAALCGMTVKTKLKEVNIGEEVPKEKEPIEEKVPYKGYVPEPVNRDEVVQKKLIKYYGPPNQAQQA